MNLSVSHLSFSYPRHFTLSDISLDFTEPLTALIGPNGAGKSTLIHCMSHLCPCRGTVRYNGKVVPFRDRDFFRRHVSFLPQSSGSDSSMTVFETVLLGLMNTLSFRVNPEQVRATERMLERLELGDLARRSLRELSGGQVQMVLLAQALIKEPEILFLDEPLNNLDIHRQFALMKLLKELSRSREMNILVVLHDIPLAARFADRIVVLRDGRLYGEGLPADVLTEKMMREVYRMNTKIHKGTDGYPVIEYLGVSKGI